MWIKWLVIRFGQDKLIFFRVNPNYLKRIFAAAFLKTVHLVVDQWGTLGFVRGLTCTDTTVVPFTASGTKMACALRGFWAQACLCTLCTLVLWPRRGRNGGAIFPFSAVSPMCPLIILTPFCTRCYAVEHENKNTLPQVYPVSIHKWVSGLPPKLCSLSCFLISFDSFNFMLIAVSTFVQPCRFRVKRRNFLQYISWYARAFCITLLQKVLKKKLKVLLPSCSWAFDRITQSSSADWVVSGVRTADDLHVFFFTFWQLSKLNLHVDHAVPSKAPEGVSHRFLSWDRFVSSCPSSFDFQCAH